MIKHLIFDLDKTVYSETSKMSEGISRRIIGYCAKFFNIEFGECVLAREKALQTYETTLSWLKACGLEDVDDYFSYVHPENEVEELIPDPNLRPLLESIKLPKVILTNSPEEHAEHVLHRLGIRDLFAAEISDIRKNDLKGKPYDFAYKNALDIIGGTVSDTLFLDDWGAYVLGYAELGGISVQVGSDPLPSGYKNYSGRIFKIKTIYELPNLLRKLNSK
ncbi:MAG: hypothetical protein IJ312_00320 [Treponema sp.]|nr:hypothetical protein [Treponema sp.]